MMDHAWIRGDRVLSSRYEHHALDRALVKLDEVGVRVTRLPGGNDELLDLEALETELKAGGVRLVALTAACNVTGRLLPISKAISVAHEYGALVLVDGAQIAGWWDLDLFQLGADMFTFAGHKGPQAPWGIGGLYVAPDVAMNCPGATCELSDKRAVTRCAVMPGYCDAGSVNLAALAGMAAGCRWLNQADLSDRLQAARNLADKFADAVRPFPGVAIQHDVPFDRKVPTVAIRFEQVLSTELAARLRQKGVICSGGLQCSPQAHLALGTDRTGVIRFSFGLTNQYSEIAQAVEILRKVINGLG
jgi:selenocysteine lyase/cysteine desulfurase